MASNVNPANAITASRFLTIPLFWYGMETDYQIAVIALISCAVLDLFDGAVARALKCITPFGEVFDAVADGICYGLMLLMLPIYGKVPWIPVALILVMGVANLVMRWAYSRRAGRPVNYRSYAMERMVAYLAYLIAFGCGGFMVDFYFWLYPVLMSIVMLHDTKRMLVDPIPAPEVGRYSDQVPAIRTAEVSS